MKRPDLSDLALLLGTVLVLHAVYRWSPSIAEFLAGALLMFWGGVIGALKANTKRSP